MQTTRTRKPRTAPSLVPLFSFHRCNPHVLFEACEKDDPNLRERGPLNEKATIQKDV